MKSIIKPLEMRQLESKLDDLEESYQIAKAVGDDREARRIRWQQLDTIRTLNRMLDDLIRNRNNFLRSLN